MSSCSSCLPAATTASSAPAGQASSCGRRGTAASAARQWVTSSCGACCACCVAACGVPAIFPDTRRWLGGYRAATATVVCCAAACGCCKLMKYASSISVPRDWPLSPGSCVPSCRSKAAVHQVSAS